MENKHRRWQIERIQEMMAMRRVLLLSGARQCGKTTLAKQIVSKDVKYLTLDDLTSRKLAKQDPHGFIAHTEKMLIIDEIQHVPTLLPAIKLAVDENTRKGQYLLTGSANIQSLPSVQESLAGRVSNLRLRALAHGEITKANPDFIDRAFKQDFKQFPERTYDRDQVLDIAFAGGYPEALTLSHKARKLWHRDYIDALLSRDLMDIANITRHHAMAELVNVLAAWSSKFMDIAAIGTGLAIRRPTLESYINALETLYLIERLPAWTKTDYARVGKQFKLFMTDSGLMSSILGWDRKKIASDPDRAGKLVETFMFNELAAQVDANTGQYELFHYRDREKREIDFLIQRADQALLGIEIKAGSAIDSSDFKHLKWFRDNIAKDKPFIGIVLYTGTLSGRMGDNLWAVPFSVLW